MQASKLIRLSESCLLGSDEAIVARLRPIVRSVEIALDRREGGFRLLGPVAPYHDLDPHLPAVLRDLKIDDPLTYRRRRPPFDFCLEDSWSGMFLAKWLEASGRVDELVFIHLDDHTDMMSLFIEIVDGVLVDPATGRPFDAGTPADWAAAIHSGSLGIGSFVTALYYGEQKLHVRHLNNFETSTYQTYEVSRAELSFPEIPGKQFATIRKRRHVAGRLAGTYQGGIDPSQLLAELPAAPVVVHIDLDYFINDFNGNPRSGPYDPPPSLRRGAIEKMDAFFAALRRLDIRVERWIVATSPGFCSAVHWHDLLGALETRIAALTPELSQAQDPRPALPKPG